MEQCARMRVKYPKCFNFPISLLKYFLKTEDTIISSLNILTSISGVSEISIKFLYVVSVIVSISVLDEIRCKMAAFKKMVVCKYFHNSLNMRIQ